MLRPTLFYSSYYIILAIAATTPPAELYSPLISSKIQSFATSIPNPSAYPQYTDDIFGRWNNGVPDTWTAGFFSATLYALNTRAKLCGTSGGAAWVELGRQWSTGIIPLETHNTVGHDVGFLSMPFVEEYYL